MKKIRLLLLLAVLTDASSMHAQRWSYVYIQGDKKIPFYVKLEGEMLPRFSKNYYIIPELEAGPIELQILFQQNEYPSQIFKVLVPEDGYRGFLLTRKDNSFALYDIQQRFYLIPGAGGEDHLPEMIPAAASRNAPAKPEAPNIRPLSSSRKKRAVQVAPAAKPIKTSVSSGEPQFIEDMVLDNTRELNQPETPGTDREDPGLVLSSSAAVPPLQPSKEYNISAEKAVEERESDNRRLSLKQVAADQQLEEDTAPIMNSDCPEPMDDAAFDKLYNNARDRDDDEKRVAFLMKKTEGNCFSSRQVYFLAIELQAESMRYSFLKKAYPRVTDQHNFHLLETHLFKTLEWKSYFRLIQ